MNLISVVLPIYNVEKYILLTLDSINNQTLNSFELIAINDGSTDLSFDIFNKYKFRQGISVIKLSQKNQGLAKTRNNGSLLANGDFITFFDSDDYYNPKHLEFMSKSTTKLVFSQFEITNEKNRQGLSITSTNPNFRVLDCIDGYKLFINRRIKFHCSAMLISKQQFTFLNGFNPNFKYGEDFDFIFRYLKTFPDKKISLLKERTYKYLIRQNSLMTNGSIEKYQLFYSNFLKTLSELKGSFAIKDENSVILRITTSIIRTSALYCNYDSYYKLLKSLTSFGVKKELFLKQKIIIFIFKNRIAYKLLRFI